MNQEINPCLDCEIEGEQCDACKAKPKTQYCVITVCPSGSVRVAKLTVGMGPELELFDDEAVADMIAQQLIDMDEYRAVKKVELQVKPS